MGGLLVPACVLDSARDSATSEHARHKAKDGRTHKGEKELHGGREGGAICAPIG
jgi:hypothetical protein